MAVEPRSSDGEPSLHLAKRKSPHLKSPHPVRFWERQATGTVKRISWGGTSRRGTGLYGSSHTVAKRWTQASPQEHGRVPTVNTQPQAHSRGGREDPSSGRT